MKNFRDLKIWKLGMEIVKETYSIASELPDNEKFALRSQITRAAVSVPSNIAEGSAKTGDKEFKMYLEIALGSLFELETQLLIIEELKLSNSDPKELLKKINEEQKMINSFITAVKTRVKSASLKPRTKQSNS